MKRFGNLYDDICSEENIRRAIHNAAKHKMPRMAVQRALNNEDDAVAEIRAMLTSRTFVPTEPHEFERYDSHRHKMRKITCTRFYPDQIVHWAVMQVMEPVFMRGMYRWSCGSVPHRGSHKAVKYVERALRNHPAKMTKYCLQMDIRKFYASIDTSKLKDMLARKVKDDGALWLLGTIIDGYGGGGLPIGYFTSQWLANFYLEAFDHHVKEKLGVRFYVRYADDLLMLGSSKRRLHQVRREVEAWICDIGLKLKPDWQVFKVDSRPISFVGFRILRTHTELSRAGFLRLCRKLRRVEKKAVCTLFDARSIVTMVGQLAHIDAQRLKDGYITRAVSLWRMKEMIRHASRVLAAAYGRGAVPA